MSEKLQRITDAAYLSGTADAAEEVAALKERIRILENYNAGLHQLVTNLRRGIVRLEAERDAVLEVAIGPSH